MSIPAVLDTTAVSEFLSMTWSRDSIMAIIQFLPMAIAQPVGAVTGSVALAESLLRLSQLADGYRTVTRLSGLVDLLKPARLNSLSSIPSPLIRQIATAEAAMSLGFYPAEHLALFTKFGILPQGDNNFKHYSSLAVFFWFWGLALKTVRLSITWFSKRSQLNGTEDATSSSLKRQLKQIQTQLIGTLCFLVFALTCVNGKTRLCTRGPLTIFNIIFETLTPPRLELPLYVRGILGTAASSVEFL